MATVLDLMKNSLAEIGYISTQQTISTADQAFVFARLNRMVDSWKTQKRYVYTMDFASYAFGTSKQTYLIGPISADFTVTSRPARIERCNLILVGTDEVRVPLSIINLDLYADIPIAALSATFPSLIYYRPTYPNGTIYPWPYPTVTTNKLELFTWHLIEKFTATTDTLSLPAGYEEALTQSLAELLCSWAGRPLTQELRDSARNARAAIAGLNIQSPMPRTDCPDFTQGGTAGMEWSGQMRGWRSR